MSSSLYNTVFSLVRLELNHSLLHYYTELDCVMLCVSLCHYICIIVYILLCICHHLCITLFSVWCDWSWITACFTTTQSWTASCCVHVCHFVTTYVLLCTYYCVYVIITVYHCFQPGATGAESQLASLLPQSWTASCCVYHFVTIYRGFPTRMVYLYYISCLSYTILVGNPWIMYYCVHITVYMSSSVYNTVFSLVRLELNHSLLHYYTELNCVVLSVSLCNSIILCITVYILLCIYVIISV